MRRLLPLLLLVFAVISRRGPAIAARASEEPVVRSAPAEFGFDLRVQDPVGLRLAGKRPSPDPTGPVKIVADNPASATGRTGTTIQRTVESAYRADARTTSQYFPYYPTAPPESPHSDVL